jgi:hypothetical protein
MNEADLRDDPTYADFVRPTYVSVPTVQTGFPATPFVSSP